MNSNSTIIKYPLISIIMPAYNVERFIERTIQSIIAQTYTNWELIIIDDGSTDATREKISPFLKMDSRIIYFYQENGKQGKARNTGIEKAKSEIIAFMDADDILIPEMLNEQYTLLNSSHADLVFSSIIYVDEHLNDLKLPHSFPYKEISGIKGAEILLKEGNPMPIITVVALKKSIMDAGCFNVSCELQFAEEYSLWIRMLLNGCKFVRNDKNVALYVMHPNQSSKLADKKSLQVLEMIHELPSPPDFQDIKNKYSSIWIRRNLTYLKSYDSNILKTLCKFQPSGLAKKISLLAAIFLPASLARKVIYKMSYLK